MIVGKIMPLLNCVTHITAGPCRYELGCPVRCFLRTKEVSQFLGDRKKETEQRDFFFFS